MIIQKQKRKRYATEVERKTARTIQNREAKRRQRIREKSGKIPPLPPHNKLVLSSYGDDLFNSMFPYPFSHSITLTNENYVTVKSQAKAIEIIMLKWVNEGIITNYGIFHEYDAGNYHAHVLIQEVRWWTDIRSKLTDDWQKGFFKVIRITSEQHRVNAIRYCLKQLDDRSTSNIIQSLIDNWSMALTISYEDIKRNALEKLKACKEEMGLNHIRMPLNQLKSFVSINKDYVWS